MSSILHGRYELLSRLGGGGMGDVWVARDLVLERDVAVKVLRRELAGDPHVRARLQAEARMAGSLPHPGIVDIFDYGEDIIDGQSCPYVVMPLIDGMSLAQLLSDGRRLTGGEVMAIVADVADALETAHVAGIIHRDLKPGNILLTRDGRVIIVDFGIARSNDGEPLTRTGMLIGTADFISPEQAAGETAGPASDLYALGIVAYTCLTGTAPFHRETEVATAIAHIQDDVPPLGDDVPPPIVELIGRLLAKRPEQRPLSSGALSAEAHVLATGLPHVPSPQDTVEIAPTRLGGTPVPVIGEASTASNLSPPVESKRRPVVYLAATALVFLAVFGLMRAFGDDSVLVPDLVGSQDVEAAAALTSLGLEMNRVTKDVADAEGGEVVRVPKAGESVDEGTVIRVVVATGKVPIPADDLLGATLSEATEALEGLGFTVQEQYEVSGETAGTVIALSPDTAAEPGTVIVVSVAATPTPPADDKKKDDKKKGKKGKKD